MPRLCFVGNMLGQHGKAVTTQGQIVSNLFATESFQTLCISSRKNKVARLFDIVLTLLTKRKEIDLVIIEVYSGLSFVIADVTGVLCRVLRIPSIMVLHGGKLPEFEKQHSSWTRRVLKRATALAAPSEFLAESFRELGFHVRVIPNVIDLSRYDFRERNSIEPKLLWMRSFHPIYNPGMAVEVIGLLRQEYPNAKLTMAGVDKGLEQPIKEMVAKQGLVEAVSFPGFLSPDQKAHVFSEADIFINTNLEDNMPVAVVEAAAFGLPVVATNVGGIPYLLSHGENGLLVEAGNARQMVEALKLLLQSSELTQKISRGGRSLAERSSWSKVRPQWEDMFAEMLNHGLAEISNSLPTNHLEVEEQKS
ncbi:MAG: glycosyltransferase family 4 protein [Blastocatellia bacterium]